jgi:hypothetical protein
MSTRADLAGISEKVYVAAGDGSERGTLIVYISDGTARLDELLEESLWESRAREKEGWRHEHQRAPGDAQLLHRSCLLGSRTRLPLVDLPAGTTMPHSGWTW